VNGIDTDRAVAIVGSLMALVIVAAAARGRGVSTRSGLVMLVIWALIIVAVATGFALLGR
jgi:tRNA(Met) C34 N-acetyltransferase TmcA